MVLKFNREAMRRKKNLKRLLGVGAAMKIWLCTADLTCLQRRQPRV